jgi:DNA replication and repair protein RecF
MEVLKKEKGFAPLLLLDDVFEKLDEDRISNLLNKVCVENEGQVLLRIRMRRGFVVIFHS